MWWIASLDGWHALRAGKDKYIRERHRTPEGRYVEGTRFARNRVAHGLHTLLYETSGMTFPVQFPMGFVEHRWRQRSDLPPPRAEERVQADAYDELLVGVPARLTLSRAMSFLLDTAPQIDP